MAIGLALSPFILIEAGLRLTAPPVEDAVDLDPLVDLHQLRPLFELNRASGRWEIPPARYNFFRPDSFLAEKPEGTRRIFVLGGSTVQGRPYSIETSFATWLRLRLEAASPGTQFEVVNCGGISYASYRVARILEEVLAHEPDAIVIYTGHNEFLEDREYAEVRAMSATRRWISRIANKSRTVTWIRSRLTSPKSPSHAMAGEVDARLDHVGGLDRYQRDTAWRAGVEHHFGLTIERMLVTTRRAGIPTVLCVPAGDLVNTPPFKVALSDSVDKSTSNAIEDAWSVAFNIEAKDDVRLASCKSILALDPEHAGAHYVAGRIHLERGETPVAIKHLSAARDFDVCPLRATSPIIESVITAANAHGIPLIDTEGLLDQRSFKGTRVSDGIADPEYFVDHLHPSVAGHRVIGEALAKEIEKFGWYTPSEDAEQRFEAAAAQHLGQLGEEYYGRGRQRLEGLRRWAAGRAGEAVGQNEHSP